MSLSGRNFAPLLNVAPSQLNQWETEKCPVSKKHFPLISKKLKIPLEEIVDLAKNWIPKGKKVQEKDCVDVLPILIFVCEILKTDVSATLTIDDIRFLIEEQGRLRSPMSPSLITELLKNRHGEK